MKRVVLCIAIMGGIVAFSLWGIFQINHLDNKFSKTLEQAVIYKKEGNTEKASEKAKDAAKLWEDYSNRISYVCHNEDLKEISLLVSQLEYLAKNDGKDFYLVCIELDKTISQLMDEEVPSFSGVL